VRCARRRYYNDLWLFDTEELRWEQVARPRVSPAPRGGCQVWVSARIRVRVRADARILSAPFHHKVLLILHAPGRCQMGRAAPVERQGFVQVLRVEQKEYGQGIVRVGVSVGNRPKAGIAAGVRVLASGLCCHRIFSRNGAMQMEGSLCVAPVKASLDIGGSAGCGLRFTQPFCHR